MIAVWMLYCVGIGLVFVVVGFALERGLHLAGRPTRWAWVVALVGSYVVPAAAWLRPDAFATFAVPIASAVQSSPSSTTEITSPTFTNPHRPPPRPFSLADLDAPLRWAWALGSIAMLLVVTTGAVRLISLRGRWRTAAVDGREVLVSPDAGPAVVGLWSPRVVLPEWALQLSERERELMLAHEEQHVRAGDPALLTAALMAVLVAPWNLALWWQWRRLRLAAEIDCDARVLAQGRSAPAYGELLLHVGGRRSMRMLGVAAFGEPRSFLESRIRRMVARVPRWRWAGVAAAMIVAIGAIVGACEAPRPLVPQAMAQEPTNRMTVPQASWLRDNIRQFFPTLGDPNGPPLDAYLIHDARLRVYQATVTERGHDEIGASDLRRAFAAYDVGHDGWVVVDRSALQGIVRDNVRVISLHHDPQPQDTMPSLEDRLNEVREQAARIQAELADRGAHLDSVLRSTVERMPNLQDRLNGTFEQARQVQARLDEVFERLRSKERDDALRTLAQQSEPAAFAGAGNAIALIVDSDNRLIAHASGTLEPGHRSCGEGLVRLLPAFRNTRFPISGCMLTGKQSRVLVYWGQLPNR